MKIQKLFKVLVLTTIVSTYIPNATLADADGRIPVDHPEEITICGDTYDLINTTPLDAGIYTNETNPRNRDYIVQAINEAGIMGLDDTFTKIEKIDRYLRKTLEYDASVVDIPWEENITQYTDFCVLNGKAVCAGYAEAFQSMCLTLGIECYYVTGYTHQFNKTEYHAWNQVIIDDQVYHIDTCWNDSSPGHYSLTDTLWEDHEIDEITVTYRISAQNFEYGQD